MKRALVIACVVATPLLAATEKWWDAYSRGVKAVNSRSYDAAVPALQKSLAEMPTESTSARAKNDIITYVPHFYLGIAKFNLGDVDGALREFKTSEDEGAIQKTPYYAQLRDWVARAQAEKVKSAQVAAGDSKKAADTALTQATVSQAQAVAAGGDRSESYRAAVRKFQEALGTFQSAGADIKAYNRAEETANQARELFARAADEGKKLRASRPAAPKSQPQPVQIAQQQQQQPVVVQPPVTQTVAPPPPPPVEAIAQVTKEEPAAKTESQTLVATKSPAQQIASPDPRFNVRSQLETAYRAFAGGRFEASEQTLSSILGADSSGQAYLLRGCARYTKAMLSKNDSLLNEAKNDFKAALKLNRKLRLDNRSFSPKLVEFFDQVRKNG